MSELIATLRNSPSKAQGEQSACCCPLSANPAPQHQVEPQEWGSGRGKAPGPSEVLDSSQQWIDTQGGFTVEEGSLVGVGQ